MSVYQYHVIRYMHTAIYSAPSNTNTCYSFFISMDSEDVLVRFYSKMMDIVDPYEVSFNLLAESVNYK